MIYNLIVTFNRSSDLRHTLNNLLSLDYQKVIVVDNASTDSTQLVLKDFSGQFPHLEILKMEHNLGGAGGFSEGMKKFVEISKSGDFLLLHDDDSFPNFHYHSATKYTANPVTTFPVLDQNKSLHPMNIPGKSDFLRNPLKLLSPAYKRRPENLDGFASFDIVDYCSFVGMLIGRATIEQIGVPSSRFFIYSDDTFYTNYISRAGAHIHVASSEHTFTHQSPRSSGNLLLNGRFAYFEARNKMIYLREFSLHKYLFCTIWFIKCLMNLNSSNLKHVLGGLYHGLIDNLVSYRPWGLK